MKEKNPKVCFVILHYKTIDDTIKCIESILGLNLCNTVILVIDNGSGDGTGNKLKSMYKDNKNIRIEVIEKNLGFSKGNNYGYTIAKKYNPDYMIVCNNDIVFLQDNLIELIERIYNKHFFGVLGPDIYIPEYEFHSNPIADRPISIKELRILKEKKIHQLKNIKWTCFCDTISGIFADIKRTIKHVIGFQRAYGGAKNNVLLQGACYILSQRFISVFDELFFPMDSFYFEEYFLYQKCEKNNIMMRYDPALAVIHTGSSATKKTLKSKIQKKKFVLENQIRSIELYINTFGDD